MRNITVQLGAESLQVAGEKLASDLIWFCGLLLASCVPGQVTISLTLGLSFKWD